MKVFNKAIGIIMLSLCHLQIASAYVNNNAANVNNGNPQANPSTSAIKNNSTPPDSNNPGVQPDSSANPGVQPDPSQNPGLQPEGDQ